MRHQIRLWTCLLAVGFLTICLAQNGIADDRPLLICCGGDTVFTIHPARSDIGKWTWKASDSPSIPESFHARFRSTDECKPYEGGLLLVTSSSGGVALIERETKKCRFLAEAKNAHSACLLPNNQLVVAASSGGDELQFYDTVDKRKPAIPTQRIPLKGGHGSVWDASGKCLWALGSEQLMRLSPAPSQNGKSAVRWRVLSKFKLPSGGGHDLSFTADRKKLLVTTNSEVLVWDVAKSSWARHKTLGQAARVKSVDVHRKLGVLVYHQATQKNWWSDTIRFDNGVDLKLPNQRLYKVRWDVPAVRP